MTLALLSRFSLSAFQLFSFCPSSFILHPFLSEGRLRRRRSDRRRYFETTWDRLENPGFRKSKINRPIRISVCLAAFQPFSFSIFQFFSFCPQMYPNK